MERLVLADYKTGFETDVKPFLLKNDAFPVLENAYIWRSRLLRKRGTALLGRLERTLTAQALGNTDGAGAFSGNIFTILGIHTPEPLASIATLTVTVGADVFTAPMVADGTLTGSTGGSGTINYATGALTLTGAPATTAVTITFGYYPDLPVMGLEDFDIGLVNEPLLISFDTRYSYGFNQGTNIFFDVTFYKATGIHFNWTGDNFQQFYTTNYMGVNTIASSLNNNGCMWATNGKPGFHYLLATYTAGTGTVTWDITFTDPSAAPFQTLVVGDLLFFNEWAGSTTVNGVTGTVSAIVNAALGQYQVTFTVAQTIAVTLTGIVQMMTNLLPNVDGIRWYDGDPNDGAAPHTFGWVNFAPPLNEYNAVTNPHPMYLVGADIITAYKNRLIFSSVFLFNTATGSTIQYYSNRIVYSQVGTPYYASPLPFAIANQAPDPTAWFQNRVGKGGFLTAPIIQQIVTVSYNGDVLLYGMESQKLKLLYTANDALPFYFQTINSELGSQSTFSGVTLDTGDLTIGQYGIALTTQDTAQRIDPQIPDAVFNISITNNNSQRVTAIRDYRNEWVYFTYCPGTTDTTSLFPNQTLLYNYRDNNWAIFNENYTRYGTFRRTTQRTWANIGQIYPRWELWNDLWNFGQTEGQYPQIVGGNQHGFVLLKGLGTGEGNSEFISAIDVATSVITSENHCLNDSDFIQVEGVIGVTDADGNSINGNIYQIALLTTDTFRIDGLLAGAYLGGGVFKRLYRPNVQTKQFPLYWNQGRGIRVGMQRYLLDKTDNGEITVNIFTSQNSAQPVNDPTINTYLPYSNVVLTSPEPNNLYNDGNYMEGQTQIWHRMSNSFTGDTVQLGFTLSNDQMRNENVNQEEIVIHAIVLDLYPGADLTL